MYITKSPNFNGKAAAVGAALLGALTVPASEAGASVDNIVISGEGTVTFVFPSEPNIESGDLFDFNIILDTSLSGNDAIIGYDYNFGALSFNGDTGSINVRDSRFGDSLFFDFSNDIYDFTVAWNGDADTLSGTDLDDALIALSEARFNSTVVSPASSILRFNGDIAGGGGRALGEINEFAVSTQTMTAVPEAPTWMMMLAGFGLAGVALRRRQDAVSAVETAPSPSV